MKIYIIRGRHECEWSQKQNDSFSDDLMSKVFTTCEKASEALKAIYQKWLDLYSQTSYSVFEYEIHGRTGFVAISDDGLSYRPDIVDNESLHFARVELWISSLEAE